MPHIPDTRHADHDRLLVAAYAAGDATGPELDEALALVAACAECAALHHDLRAIAAALPALPAPVRRRDFRLTPGQAASLRPAGWRRLLAPLAGPRFAFAGPLGTGLATLGIAGLLVAGSLGAPLAATPAAGEGPGTPGTESVAQAGPTAAPADVSASGAPAMPAAPASAAAVQGGPISQPAPSQAPAASRGAGGGEWVGAAASPGASAVAGDPYATILVDPGNANGIAGAAPDASPGTKSAMPADARPEPAPSTSVEADRAGDARLEATPQTVPFLGLAAVLLVAGFLLAGLRLVARRLA